MPFWYDGQLISGTHVTLAIDEPGLLYGATVFSTLRVYQQSLTHPLTAWSAHCRRLQDSLSYLGWPEPNWQKLQTGADSLKAHFPILRLAILPDGREWILGRPLPPTLEQWHTQGIKAWVAQGEQYQRWCPSHKTGNYLGAWLAQQEAQHHGTEVAILKDIQGDWLETSTGNLWAWGQNRWWTPPCDDRILSGIVRSQLADWLRSQGIALNEQPWSLATRSQFEVLACCNSVVQVVAITQVSQGKTRNHYPSHHPMLEHLQSYFQMPA